MTQRHKEPDGEHEDQKAIGQLSFDTRVLATRLAKLAANEPSSFELVRYSELSAIIGRNVQGKARGNLMAARRKVLREHGIVIGVILDQGVKRLNDVEIVKSGASVIRHINRTSVRGMRHQIEVNFEKLSREQQKEFNLTLSVLQLSRVSNSPKFQSLLAERVLKRQLQVDPRKLLESLREGK
jgi:hypothetical protein